VTVDVNEIAFLEDHDLAAEDGQFTDQAAGPGLLLGNVRLVGVTGHVRHAAAGGVDLSEQWSGVFDHGGCLQRE
jgi:hypothetical protein